MWIIEFIPEQFTVKVHPALFEREGEGQKNWATLSRAVVPNLWPAGQKWPARPQKVALDLLDNFKNIYVQKLQNFPFWKGWPVEYEPLCPLWWK